MNVIQIYCFFFHLFLFWSAQPSASCFYQLSIAISSHKWSIRKRIFFPYNNHIHKASAISSFKWSTKSQHLTWSTLIHNISANIHSVMALSSKTYPPFWHLQVTELQLESTTLALAICPYNTYSTNHSSQQNPFACMHLIQLNITQTLYAKSDFAGLVFTYLNI